jgi:nucleotide-binding universal stress UspA family protein
MAIIDGPIVFLTPGSAESLAALPDLAGFAAALGRRLTILHMLGRADVNGRVGAALAALAPGGPAPELLSVPPDEVAAALARIAESGGGILALLPRRPRAFDRFLVGSEYERLLRSGPLPVLALPDGGRIVRPARVLFPADLAPRSVAAFDAAVAICRTLGAELHLLHVFGDDRLLPAEQDQAHRRAAQSPRDLLTIDQGRLRELAERANAQGVHTHCRTAEGRAHTQILSYAASAVPDLIVMPSHGPRTIEDIFRGSSTVRVIHRATVSVLAMRA